MKILKLTALLFIFFSIPSFSAFADTQQKMIIVKGKNSFLMDGDPYRNAHNKPRSYGKSKVLPALLSIGWQIKSIHVNEKSSEDNLYGYVLIERTN